MKKEYRTPKMKGVDLFAEDQILTASGDRFTIDMSDESAAGAEALSKEKDMWGNENIWK